MTSGPEIVAKSNAKVSFWLLGSLSLSLSLSLFDPIFDFVDWFCKWVQKKKLKEPSHQLILVLLLLLSSSIGIQFALLFLHGHGSFLIIKLVFSVSVSLHNSSFNLSSLFHVHRLKDTYLWRTCFSAQLRSALPLHCLHVGLPLLNCFNWCQTCVGRTWWTRLPWGWETLSPRGPHWCWWCHLSMCYT